MTNKMQQLCPDELHAGAVITVEEVVLVKPVKPTFRHCMYLSATDMLMRFSKPSRTILFYPPSFNSKDNITDRPTSNAFTTLQQGLAAALTPYYPFAGRLVLDNNGRLVLDCNDAGIELTRCQCDTMLFSDLMADNYVPRSFFRQLVPMDDLPRSDHTDVPVTAVQITAFSGGGFTVGIANQHSIADGFAFWMFIKTLGQACRGEPLTVQPLHWRAVLRPDTAKLNCKFAPKQVVKQDIIPTSTDDAHSYSFSSSPTDRLMQVVVHFSKEMIGSLKKAACLSCTSTDSVVPDSTFTTYQALSAYLWKRYIMARGLEAKAPVQFLHLLDIRQRIVPPLTSGYCGNAIAGFFTISKAGDIQQESLGMTAARIRQTIQDVDDYSIKAFVEDVENPDLFNIPVNLFRLRNASRFPIYEAGDLGWGEPAAVRPPVSDTEGEATWYPSGKERRGGVDVVFALLQTTCSRYFSPTLFPNDPLDISQLQYTTAVCM